MTTDMLPFAQLATEIEREGLSPKNAVRVAGEIAKALGVREHEVGILRLDGRVLRFVHPPKFATVGAIPVNSSIAVAARVMNEKKPEIINNLPHTKHVSVFESIELQKKPKVAGQRPNPDDQLARVIQKMISVPVVGPAGVAGVIEVSRKGRSAPEAGPDFTAADLQKLTGIAAALAKCFK